MMVKKPPEDLLDLPDDCLGHIVKHCDFPSVQVLRRTNHRLQNIVSVVKPRSHIHEIYVEFKNNSIRLGILLNRNSESTKFYPEGSKILIEYSNYNMKCMVKLNMENDRAGVYGLRKMGRQEIKQLNEKGLCCTTVFFQDLNSILAQMDGPCDIFHIDSESDYYLERLAEEAVEIIPAKKLVLKTSLGNWSMQAIAKCLQKFEPGTLKHIHLINESILDRNESMSTNIANLDQWKQAERLEMDYYIQNHDYGMYGIIKHFLHFSSFNVMFDSLGVNDLIALKNDLILHIDQPPKNREIYLTSMRFDDIEHFFGPPNPDDPEEAPHSFPIHQKLNDLRESQMNRYFSQGSSSPTRPRCSLEQTDLPDRIESFSWYFDVPGRSVVLRMRFMREKWNRERWRGLGKVEVSFVPRNGVDEERIVYNHFVPRYGVNAQL